MTTLTDTAAHLTTLLGDTSKWPGHNIWYSGKGGATYSEDSDFAFMTIMYYSVLWFVVLMGLMGYFVIKYRRRAGQPAPVSPSHSTKIEIAWTVIPSLTLVAMFILGFRGYTNMLVPENSSGLDIDLVARKWSWTMTYPNGAGSSINEVPNIVAAKEVPVFFMPEDTPVRMRMISQDVMHSFWVPDFRAKIDVMPNRYTKYWFRAEKLDTASAKRITNYADPASPWHFLQDTPYVDHYIMCAEYCGDFHSEMTAVIRVIPKDKFREWSLKADSAEPPAVRGKKLYENNCATCHSIDGSAKTGPSWKNIFGATHTMEGGASVVVNEDYVRESIWNPQAKIVAGYKGVLMTSFAGMDEKNIAAIIAFMKSEWVHEKWAEIGGADKQGKPAGGAAPAGDKPAAGTPATPAPTPANAPTPTPAPETKK